MDGRPLRSYVANTKLIRLKENNKANSSAPLSSFVLRRPHTLTPRLSSVVCVIPPWLAKGSLVIRKIRQALALLLTWTVTQNRVQMGLA